MPGVMSSEGYIQACAGAAVGGCDVWLGLPWLGAGGCCRHSTGPCCLAVLEWTNIYLLLLLGANVIASLSETAQNYHHTLSHLSRSGPGSEARTAASRRVGVIPRRPQAPSAPCPSPKPQAQVMAQANVSDYKAEKLCLKR